MGGSRREREGEREGGRESDLLSVSLEKKKPQVGFMAVWNGEMELPMSRRGTEEEGREPATDDCREEGMQQTEPCCHRAQKTINHINL